MIIDKTDGQIEQIPVTEAKNQLKEYNVIPNHSINGIRLISPRLEVRRVFGKPLKTGQFMSKDGRVGYYDVFNGINVIYNHRLYSEEFQIYAGIVKINKFQIFPGKVKDFVKCFPDTYQVVDGWISRDYAMAIKEQDGTINSIHIGYEGYYD